jgi:hypothetical protein
MTGKMWRSFGVGMNEAIDLAKTEPEPPTAAKCKQSCYAMFFCTIIKAQNAMDGVLCIFNY